MTTHPTRLAWSESRRAAWVNVPVNVYYSDDAEQSPTALHEKHRWLLLVIPLAMSAASFAAAIGTGTYWLLIPAAALGPWTLIAGFVHLALSGDPEQSAEERHTTPPSAPKRRARNQIHERRQTHDLHQTGHDATAKRPRSGRAG